MILYFCFVNRCQGTFLSDARQQTEFIGSGGEIKPLSAGRDFLDCPADIDDKYWTVRSNRFKFNADPYSLLPLGK
ncbi:MAG: hypothetical protein ACKOB4_18255 [Acidobacteriota bacterium]